MRTSNKKKKRKKEGWRNERPTFVPSSLCLSGIKVTATTAMPQVINRLSARGSNNFYPENQWLFSGRKRVTKLSSSLLFFFLYLLFFFWLPFLVELRVLYFTYFSIRIIRVEWKYRSKNRETRGFFFVREVWINEIYYYVVLSDQSKIAR